MPSHSKISIDAIGLAYTPKPGLDFLGRFEAGLDHLQKIGFGVVELSPEPFALIVNGALRRDALADFASILSNFDLRYSLHAPNRLNLAYDSRQALSLAIFENLLEICRGIGASRLVYHSGLQALDEARHGVRRKLLSHDELRTGRQQEIEAFRRLGPLAADSGVVIGMENGDSHLWEHTLMAQFGLPSSALLDHHARLHTAPIVEQLEAINHPNVAMTLDVGHLYIAANDMGFDYLEAVEIAAPWVRHLHVNDNFGKLDRGFDSESVRWVFGEADLHLPPGWGTVPYEEIFPRLRGYKGDLILEIKEGFADHLPEALSTMKQLIDQG